MARSPRSGRDSRQNEPQSEIDAEAIARYNELMLRSRTTRTIIKVQQLAQAFLYMVVMGRLEPEKLPEN